MKAILCPTNGSPDVLQLAEVEKPIPEPDQVLVRVRAAAANPLDYHMMHGGIARVVGWLMRRPHDPRFGADLAGVVEAVSSNVTQFQPGDEVFGTGAGAFAEYAVPRADRLARKPANSSFEAAAAVPVAAITALQGLRDTGHIQSGQSVLVNGASGGVGTFAVQIAKSYGTEVSGVCSTRNLDLVRSIGAEHVIDYTREDFTRNGQRYDLVYDAVGNRSVSDYWRALKPGGRCVIAGFSGATRLAEHLLLGPLRSKMGNKTVGLMGVAKINQADLNVLRELIEAGKIIPVIDRCYPLAQTADAIRYLEKGHARGKVIVVAS